MAAPLDDDVITTGLQRLVIGLVLIVLAIGLGVQITLEADIDVDEWWNSFVDVFSFLQPLSLALNFLGGGWFATFVVPLGVAAILLAVRRPWGALFALCASAGAPSWCRC
ncbi:MAG: hypothetical protein R2692_07000 [Microbacterium sp.]